MVRRLCMFEKNVSLRLELKTEFEKNLQVREIETKVIEKQMVIAQNLKLLSKVRIRRCFDEADNIIVMSPFIADCKERERERNIDFIT